MKHANSRIILLFCCMFVAFTPVIGLADWGFRMGDDGWNPEGTKDYSFDKIQLFIPEVPQNSGITWSGTGIGNFSSTNGAAISNTWKVDTATPTYVSASGSAVTGILYWDVLFSGSVPNNFRLDYIIWSNGSPAFGLGLKIKDGVLNTNPNGGWKPLKDSEIANYQRVAAVPVPPTIFLFGAGLIGAVVLRKKVTHQKEE